MNDAEVGCYNLAQDILRKLMCSHANYAITNT